MAFIPTTYLPLTTTFTAPAECTNGPWMYVGEPTTWWKVGGDNVPSCFPSGYPFSRSRVVYSPGICPAGWESACGRMLTTGSLTTSVVSCCPKSFKCAATNPEHNWEDQFGCASPFSVDAASWKLSASNVFVSSIYQLPVMIAETVR
ncbi:hypothetical protein CC80DRAFT_205963 [Byssothecium circinans]|uniref:Uncharacterized protein n=1 Tax=Byssothecium circinans TaxID=147558 RepID=A0A6A5THI5_9PLEO|nr:hypothetical protein CC80DRAFT_205963 [Byssothecium circinans]